MAFHIPVLLNPAIDLLITDKNGLYADLTTGEGGHSRVILEHLSEKGILFCFDRDETIQALAKENLKNFLQARFIRANFSRVKEMLLKEGARQGVNGILADLGLSMFHYKASEKGFSFLREDPLDMSLDQSRPNAFDVVNSFTPEQIADILFQYGEERQSRKIARFIDAARKIKKIETTRELASIIAKAAGFSKKKGFHPATKSFQALRIFVNQELENLKTMMEQSLEMLCPGGRLVIITYHSLEDRMVKQTFREKADSGRFRLLTRKAVMAQDEEIAANPSSRSARLRALEKI